MPVSFEPVLLNLVDMEDYAVLVAALHDYATVRDSEADDDESAQFEGIETPTVGAEDLRRGAARARALVEEVERQLDANKIARRGADL